MTLVCAEAGCPLGVDGRCLEGIADARDCPHTRDVAQEELEPEAEDQEPDSMPVAIVSEEAVDVADEVSGGDAASVDLRGDQSLSIAEADAVAARHSARVILVAGAFASGKTSLVAGLYGLFLDGPVAGRTFAGATSLVALDARYHGKRASTGLALPESQRTRDEDMRLLDLRLVDRGRRVNLLFSDVRGEYFEDVVSGRPVAEAVSLADRADVGLLLLDGHELADVYGRNSAISFGRQLIGGLTEAGGLRPGLPFALVVSKADKLDGQGQGWLDQRLDELADFAAARGLGPVERFMTAAFADPGQREHVGLVPLLEWLLATPSAPTKAPVVADPEGVRSYLRGATHG